MCNPNPSSPSLSLSSKKTHNVNLIKSTDLQPDSTEELHRWPTPSEVKKEGRKKIHAHIHIYIYIYHLHHEHLRIHLKEEQ
jgi:hypothetical protein